MIDFLKLQPLWGWGVLLFLKYKDERQGPYHVCGPISVRGSTYSYGTKMPSLFFIISKKVHAVLEKLSMSTLVQLCKVPVCDEQKQNI